MVEKISKFSSLMTYIDDIFKAADATVTGKRKRDVELMVPAYSGKEKRKRKVLDLAR